MSANRKALVTTGERSGLDRLALDKVRKRISDCFGGMGPTSAIWSNNPYDKGHSAGVLAALTAFDTEVAALLAAIGEGE